MTVPFLTGLTFLSSSQFVMHPEKIGPYRIDRKIGAGGMGNVYLGVHEETSQQVAVKVLPASMAREEMPKTEISD